MATTVVGLFDQAAQAQAVMSELESSGFSRKFIDTVKANSDAGGVASTLSSAGVPREDASLYAEGVKQGGTLVSLRSNEEDADKAIAIFNRHNPIDIDERSMKWRSGGTQTAASADVTTTRTKAAATTGNKGVAADAKGQTAIPIVEEEMRVGKRQVQRGGIRVFQRVEEKPVEEKVSLREEHVRVDRHAVDRPATDADFNKAFTGASLELTETSEEAVVQKQARVVEEVVVGKEATQRTETVRDTVRRTDVEVQQIPGSGAASSTEWDTYDADFRKGFSGQGYTYDQARPAFRYGYDLSSSGKGGDWSSVESDARTRWEQSHPGTWEKFKGHVRQAYDKARAKV